MTGDRVIATTTTTTDAQGLWDAVVLGGTSMNLVRAIDPAAPTT
jgi:hypothetical protein